MTWILNLAYLTALMLLSPLIAWRAVRHGRYRAGWKEKLLGRLPALTSKKPVVWFHAVSVGEVLQLQKVVEQFRQQSGDVFHPVITTSTDTGFELATSRFPDCTVTWFPLDFSWAVNAALRHLQPELVVLVELELWPNFLRACQRQRVRTALINARLSDRSYRGYRRLTWLLQPIFKQFAVVAAQNQQYADRLSDLGTTSQATHVTGSIKYDGVQTDRQHEDTQALRRLFGIADSDIVFIAGSTQDPEESLAIDAWKAAHEKHPNLRLILVPRHRERFDEVAAEVVRRGYRLIRRSELAQPVRCADGSIILLDTIGELSACWGLADIAFVGGSFGLRGGQNMLEPAAYGAATLFGPNTWNFKQIVSQLLSHQAAVQLPNESSLAEQLLDLLRDESRRQQMGVAAQTFVKAQAGALRRTIELLQQTLETESAESARRAA